MRLILTQPMAIRLNRPVSNTVGGLDFPGWQEETGNRGESG